MPHERQRNGHLGGPHLLSATFSANPEKTANEHEARVDAVEKETRLPLHLSNRSMNKTEGVIFTFVRLPV